MSRRRGSTLYSCGAFCSAKSFMYIRLMYGGRVRLPSDEVLQEIRRKTARGAAWLLRLGALGGGAGDSWSIDVERSRSMDSRF